MSIRLGVLVSVLLLCACAGGARYDDTRIGSLNKEKVKVEEPQIKDSLERAMQSYRKYLEEAPESAATPEAMRRLADLQLEAGTASLAAQKTTTDAQAPQSETAAERENILTSPQQRLAQRKHAVDVRQKNVLADKFGKTQVTSDIFVPDASEEQAPREAVKSFEQRATQISAQSPQATTTELEGIDQEKIVITNTNTQQAIDLYKELLRKYPLYERNDQVLYQLARAYEEGGQQEEAMQVLNQLIVQFPQSHHYDEAQFRRGEIFFVRKQYLDAEKAYQEVLDIGFRSAFYDQALFKQGWAFFKQSLFEEGLDDFVKLLDIKVTHGYHLNPDANKTEYQRMLDAFRVMSLSFSYMGGPGSIASFFEPRGGRDYEDMIYSHLGDHYLEKRRYQDAADSYVMFVERYPMHKRAPEFHIRTMEIYKKGNFPKLVIDSKREFAATYALDGAYWSQHDINQFPDILQFIKINLVDLAKHYHELSQRTKKPEDKHAHYLEAVVWYRAFLKSFSDDEQAPGLNFLLAEILYDNKNYRDAAQEYERTAYGYPLHEHASASGYAAVLSYREYEKQLEDAEKALIHLQMIRSSLQFAETYPDHKEAVAVLTNAAESLFALNEFQRAHETATKVLQRYPQADVKLITTAWTIAAHASFDMQQYVDAELGYAKVLALITAQDERFQPINDRLAASIYKQAEQHRAADELQAAADDFLRIGKVAPQSQIRAAAEYDASAVLITLKNWPAAERVLLDFRKNFARHELLHEVTKKLAIVYEESGKAALAAKEYVAIAEQTEDPAIRKESLQIAAGLYEKAEAYREAVDLHLRYVQAFPEPLDIAQESRQKAADLYVKLGDENRHRQMLQALVDADRQAGTQTTPRSQYLAAHAALKLAESAYFAFKNVRLGEPFQKTLKEKKSKMEAAIKVYADLADYAIPEVTAASTYKIAGIYYQLSVDLLQSERPRNLTAEQLEQYELILEEQAYPFEEKAIGIHEKNIELISKGVYNSWVDKSIEQLSTLMPARYNKQEQGERFVQSIQ